MIHRQTIFRTGVALLCLAGAHRAAAQEEQKTNVLKPIIVGGGGDAATGPVNQ